MNTSGELVPVVTVPVQRANRHWIAEIPTEGIWTHGKTLTEIRAQAHAALALARGLDPDCIAVRVSVDSPELDALADARRHERAALAAAATRLRSQGVPWRDTAHALGVTQREAREAWEESDRLGADSSGEPFLVPLRIRRRDWRSGRTTNGARWRPAAAGQPRRVGRRDGYGTAGNASQRHPVLPPNVARSATWLHDRRHRATSIGQRKQRSAQTHCSTHEHRATVDPAADRLSVVNLLPLENAELRDGKGPATVIPLHRR